MAWDKVAVIVEQLLANSDYSTNAYCQLAVCLLP